MGISWSTINCSIYISITWCCNMATNTIKSSNCCIERTEVCCFFHIHTYKTTKQVAGVWITGTVPRIANICFVQKVSELRSLAETIRGTISDIPNLQIQIYKMFRVLPKNDFFSFMIDIVCLWKNSTRIKQSFIRMSTNLFIVAHSNEFATIRHFLAHCVQCFRANSHLIWRYMFESIQAIIMILYCNHTCVSSSN